MKSMSYTKEDAPGLGKRKKRMRFIVDKNSTNEVTWHDRALKIESTQTDAKVRIKK